MSQTALNLTAIAIFLMTMTALLGPIFNLSPTLPAIATFSLLGLATLDSFSLQGKGGTLVLDWLASFSPQHRDRIIRHEAGHFLVAHLLGIPVTGYALSAWEALQQKQPGQGGVSFDDTEVASQLAQGTISAQLLDRYCTIWMAGIAAETLVYDCAEGGTDDRQHLHTVLSSLGFSATSVELKQRFCSLQARNLLQQNWTAYEALVTAMQKRTDVAECRSLVNSLTTINN
ncbi:ATP-dependent Zn protease [Gloeocapsopsis dulcis]|uniref:ATP-dependent Zn protease n=1 Tax=Gloeocapsopsis dulcis AAB1 = 1H9 TaxID=1433147 RepID=A0A6N8G0Z9_9CHRO|nr:ATP-dependent Zn protease [Gloeocapsopsis dulcis]MUL38881.1 ATP-dependent Zn protease [Gloeocapsopsis dulcis AAB1 = 1H9]WNN89315.1 ATP-dependent Zn protease [Gloeocapsopsis dulcis]